MADLKLYDIDGGLATLKISLAVCLHFIEHSIRLNGEACTYSYRSAIERSVSISEEEAEIAEERLGQKRR